MEAYNFALTVQEITALAQQRPGEVPTLDAGPNQSKVLQPAVVQLSGSASGPVSWTVVSGPGQVTFSNPTIVNPQASFWVPGEYELRLDDSHGNNDTVRIEIIT